MNRQEEHSTAISDELAREWSKVEPRVERLGRLLDEMESIIGTESNEAKRPLNGPKGGLT